MPKTATASRTKGRTADRRRPAPKRREWPILPITVAAVFTVAFVGLIAASYFLSRTSEPAIHGQSVANIRCDTGEQLSVHYHAHITILYRGAPVSIPANTGILTGNCFYWMHTHTTTGIVHIEAPKDSATRGFTVGDFFQIWNQPLTKKQVATFPLGKGDQVKVWVDGKPYTGDPAKVVLKSHTQVVIEIGPSFIDPPTYDWTSAEATSEAGTGG